MHDKHNKNLKELSRMSYGAWSDAGKSMATKDEYGKLHKKGKKAMNSFGY